ncbi:MAG: nitroreductase family protein [Candidatus Omnitrophica bacterium]|nr:nitroreductase family protein [Candidatus Omnitrophota bacterium]
MSSSNPVLVNIQNRRSIRRFTGQRVSREDLELLVRAGMAAPSSRDTRHWYFIVVDDEGVVNKLAEGLPYAKMLLTAKHAIIVASNLAQAHGGSETDYWVQDCSAAVENILLAAQSLGLGTCWTAAHPRPERIAFVKSLLGIPQDVVPLCVIAVGHPTGDDKPRDKFDPARLFWNKWQ